MIQTLSLSKMLRRVMAMVIQEKYSNGRSSSVRTLTHHLPNGPMPILGMSGRCDVLASMELDWNHHGLQ
ncbi:MAG: hypothetical protein HKO93_02345 [Flavobacteriales bacterium]|nr:hypothetical protein [Flavobacteriales bacterium]